MNGTLKSLLASAGLWVAAGIAWLFVVALSAAMAGKGMGTALTVAMLISWGSALLLSLGVVMVGKTLIWKWMPEGGRVAVLLALIAAQAATFVLEGLSVFVIFNR
ncbi:MAG: hypothetical protein Q8L48_09585 [Archangium sp.]|nr:hypothetical protein [Archangium sp.]